MSFLCRIYVACSLFVGNFTVVGIQSMIDSMEMWMTMGNEDFA